MRNLPSSFFILTTFFLITPLSGFSDPTEVVHDTKDATYGSGEMEKQVGSLEDPNYLFDSIQAHQFFSANFEQTTVKEKNERIVEGKIIAHRSGIFKISYHEPLNEIMFSDGKDFYRYDPELEQVNVQPLDQLLSETPIGLFTLNADEIKELFSVSECEKTFDKYTCLLTSKNEESFIKWVDISIKNRVFSSLRYLDSFGQKVSLKFKNTSIVKIPSEEFKLVIPEGTDIVSYENTIK